MVLPIPNHGSKDIKTGTLHAICKEIGLKNRNELDGI
jgi:predicted RNA binding protein YcfA (HicA-like mRNA interferase family)